MKRKSTKKPKPQKVKGKKPAAISFKQPPNAGKRSILNTPMYR